jgi:hypothetical protein
MFLEKGDRWRQQRKEQQLTRKFDVGWRVQNDMEHATLRNIKYLMARGPDQNFVFSQNTHLVTYLEVRIGVHERKYNSIAQEAVRCVDNVVANPVHGI